jgi:hypothetical protein
MNADESRVPPVAVLVDQPRHDALAGPRFPEKENGALRRRHRADLLENLPHFRAPGSHDVLDVAHPELVPEIIQFGLDDQGLVDALHDVLHFFRIDGIGEVVARPGLDGHDRLPDRLGGGHNDDLHVGKGHPEGLEGPLVAVPRRRRPEKGKIHENESWCFLFRDSRPPSIRVTWSTGNFPRKLSRICWKTFPSSDMTRMDFNAPSNPAVKLCISYDDSSKRTSSFYRHFSRSPGRFRLTGPAKRDMDSAGCGEPESGRRALENGREDPGRPLLNLITHAHYDHCGAFPV